MPVETIIRQDSPQIWVVDEEDTEQIVYLSLVPVRAIIETANRRDGSGFICVGLDSNARVVSDREEVVDDFEARITCRVVDCGDVADLGEFCGGVVLEEGEGGDDAGGRDVDG